MKLTTGTNASGMVLMVLAMAAFAFADTLIKVSSSSLSSAQVLFFLIAGGLILFALMAKVQGQKLIDHRAFAPILLLRYLAEIIGMAGMVQALANVPLSTVGAITQATPILVAVGAVLFLGEKVSWRRWSSITVGFFGVLLVVQPGSEQLDFNIFWAVVAMVAMSVRDLVTRLTPPDMASASLATFTMLAALPFAAGWVFYNGESLFPAQANWVVVISMVGLGSLGYLSLISSLRAGSLSVVMPFRFTRIIFLLLLGILVFEETPSFSMLSGAALIIISGVYVMWREQRLKATRWLAIQIVGSLECFDLIVASSHLNRPGFIEA